MGRDTYTISQVVRILESEYEDLTASSLRFLEREGMVTPGRTAGGHRRYTAADVERVRAIKEMQRRFLPLSLIRDLLRESHHPKGKGESLFFRPYHHVSGFVPLSRADLAPASGLDETRLEAMESLRMLSRSPDGTYDEDDLQAARTMKGLVDHGLEPADLAFYVTHNEAMVEQEMRLMLSKAMAGRRLDETESVALRMEELGDSLRHVLHAKLLRQAALRLADDLRQV